MFIEDTPCCGMSVISGLTPDSGELQTVMEDAKNDNKGLVISTVNDQEKKAWAGKFLRKEGFKILHTFKNPNSGNRVWVYYKSTARIKRTRPKDDYDYNYCY